MIELMAAKAKKYDPTPLAFHTSPSPTLSIDWAMWFASKAPKVGIMYMLIGNMYDTNVALKVTHFLMSPVFAQIFCGP